MAFENLVRRARMSLQAMGLVHKYKINIYEGNAPDNVERHQNYGTASAPAQGEGLVIDIGGTVFVLAVDSIKDRPKLANWDVALWHKDGHSVHLKAGKVVDVNCTTFNLKAKTVNFDAPTINTTGRIVAAGDVTGAGVSLGGHTHQENDVRGQSGTAKG